MTYRKLLVLLGLWCLSQVAFGQEDGGRIIREESTDTKETDAEDEHTEEGDQKIKPRRFRKILNKVTFTSSLGYGLNHYRQSLTNYNLDYNNGTYYLYSGSLDGNSSRVVENWTNAPNDVTGYNRGNIAEANGDTLALRGFNHSLPLTLGLHVLIKERFKIGGGIGLELFSIGTLKFKESTEFFNEYDTDVSSALAFRYYATLGYRTQHFLFWDNYADLHIGKRNPITQFSDEKNSLFFNAGYQMERNYSEYLRFTIRPSLEYHAFTTKPIDKGLKTNVPSFYLEAGVSINYPTLPRCPINGCETQVNHAHYGNEYRGQPITRWQNPKMGQNHRELERIKRRKKDDTEQELQYKKPSRRKFPWIK